MRFGAEIDGRGEEATTTGLRGEMGQKPQDRRLIIDTRRTHRDAQTAP
jgi:hypothetical protein